MRRTEMTRANARQKGFLALGAASATVVLSMWLSPFFLLFGAPLTLWMAYKWLRYRAEWGMRF